MNVTQTQTERRAAINLKTPLVAFLLLATLVWLVQITAPYSQGWSLLWDTVFHYDAANYQHLITHLTYLPRLAIAVICGFALAIAGCVMQFVLRNPIASPTTLGVAAGAELGMVLGILLLPAGMSVAGFIPAFIGGCLATFLVFALSAKRGFSPVHMVLAGMVVSLFFGALNTMLLLLHEQQLTSVFVWGAGTLNQNDWSSVTTLLPLVIIPTLLLLVLQRPLSALQFGDGVASSLGVNVKQIKVACLTLAIFVTAAVVSEVGLIGFVGIVAPALARMLGARALHWQILISGLVGATMLLLADLSIQPFSGVGGELLPTGAMTALLGAPFLLWLLQRKSLQSDLKARDEVVEQYRHRSLLKVVSGLVIVLVVAVVVGILVGKNQTGWSIADSMAVLELRLPRVFVALLAGIGLAFAGTIIQRVSNNPMASPEILGISSGAALALVLGAMLGFAVERHEQMLLGTSGALLVTGLVWLFGRKHNFAPTQTLLTGIALSAGLDAFLRIAMTSGQDNVRALLTWLSGSTYLVSSYDIGLLLVGVTVLGGAALLAHRWIELIGLGEITASSIGIDCRKVRLLLLILVAAITTLCTIVIGPLSFIGLLAPHMARSLNQYQAKNQLITAALIGAVVMVMADWIGRTLWFPWQFPAGLLASILGGAYFLYLMRK
ncbi:MULTISPECIES: Fe(3+)-hydroxamate ABC transporter permease FhuB [Vibrio]|uniref:Fe(3+)-hydroxamate ABC transporter permease FhuB n=1 Tax=Vibrio TaxID=662 RepID=UPI0001B94235|nr:MULTISPECIES: Fe(3+)-hydroxamate ABC transporter permease FhuB [Vibrio]EEX32499.1 ferric aerobactin ABC transporter permease component [Vibrio coralliilyticus ATCC BAA-450]MCM5507991.1 Fe(3+)-hydroxamate ABC transporter permease FhuB [Vibrio sp. SCSIO 43169]MDE3897541.1 Fe(3+)-hydroxamate ABC transporter permease FhuB [Vibrio sp. CC007]QFT39201.1 Iron(3+)-hydroxamate import system permease protein FhuB [Vibrio sp. THAF64]QGM36261.1 Iron(3+)-hydroxamate import system permease protein FhuB [V